jgi:hypothetical protein
VADRLQAGGLYEHCLAEFGRALTVEMAVQQLVWAHGTLPRGRGRWRWSSWSPIAANQGVCCVSVFSGWRSIYCGSEERCGPLKC